MPSQPPNISAQEVAQIRSSALRDILDVMERETADLQARYDELIYAVARRHEAETRHQTALRYIREAENNVSGPAQEKAPS